MSQIAAQYVAGALVLIGIFLLFSDPKGTVDIMNSFANFNTGAIAALQGRGVSQTAGPAARRGR